MGYEMGTRDQVVGADNLRLLRDTPRFSQFLGGPGGNTPVAFPELFEGEALICGLVRFRGDPEVLYRCDSLAEMEHLYRHYYSGAATLIDWYLAPDFKVLTFLRGDAKL
jgi:hypothetical protein